MSGFSSSAKKGNDVIGLQEMGLVEQRGRNHEVTRGIRSQSVMAESRPLPKQAQPERPMKQRRKSTAEGEEIELRPNKQAEI